MKETIDVFLVTALHVAEELENGNVALAVQENELSELWTPGKGTLGKAEEHDAAVMELKDSIRSAQGLLNF